MCQLLGWVYIRKSKVDQTAHPLVGCGNPKDPWIIRSSDQPRIVRSAGLPGCLISGLVLVHLLNWHDVHHDIFGTFSSSSRCSFKVTASFSRKKSLCKKTLRTVPIVYELSLKLSLQVFLLFVFKPHWRTWKCHVYLVLIFLVILRPGFQIFGTFKVGPLLVINGVKQPL